MTRLIVALAFVLLPATVFAQARPGSPFGWEMDHPHAVAQAFRYELELDGKLLPTPLTHTCIVSAEPVFCTAPIPAITPGKHDARLRAVDMSVPTSPIVSAFSPPHSFEMQAVPSTPKNFGVRPQVRPNP